MDKPIMSAGPHIHSKDSSSRIMLDVIIALLPAAIGAVILLPLIYRADLQPGNVPPLSWISPLFGIAFVYLSYKFWMLGVRKYDFTGS